MGNLRDKLTEDEWETLAKNHATSFIAKVDDKQMQFPELKREKKVVEVGDIDTPKYYDNSNGSIYLFAHQHKLNPWETDIIKRIIRCRKKGHWEEDLGKSEDLIALYRLEYGALQAKDK